MHIQTIAESQNAKALPTESVLDMELGGATHQLSFIPIESHPKDSRYVFRGDFECNQAIVSIMCHDPMHGGIIMQRK